jgi:hypothetical protein
MAHILSMVSGFQKMPFPFEYNQDIGYYLLSAISETEATSKSDQMFYERSLLLEPRNPTLKEKMMYKSFTGTRFEKSGKLPNARDSGIVLPGQVAAESPITGKKLMKKSGGFDLGEKRGKKQQANAGTAAASPPKESRTALKKSGGFDQRGKKQSNV